MSTVRPFLVASLLALSTASLVVGQGPCLLTDQITEDNTELEGLSMNEGGTIAFSSSSDLVGQNPDRNREIYVYELANLTLFQITRSTTGDSITPSVDGELIAFSSTSDLDPDMDNSDGNSEIFLYDDSNLEITQITDSTGGGSVSPSLDEGSITFTSSSDLDPDVDNSDGNSEIFLYDGSEIMQITDSANAVSLLPQVSEGSIVFQSNADHLGDNPDGNSEIFLVERSGATQITKSTEGDSVLPSVDGDSIAFASEADLTGSNPDGGFEIFSSDGSTLAQISRSPKGESLLPDVDGRAVAFASEANLTGENPDGNGEIFVHDGSEIVQITSSTAGGSFSPDLEGSYVAFASEADLTGENPDGSPEVFLTLCPCLSESVACLQDRRFEVEVDWKSEPTVPNERPALVSELGTADSAIFYFDDPDNLELLVKVLDGCSLNDRYWVFLAGTTDVEFTVTVTDTFTNEQSQYSNAQGSPANAVTDTDAFATCF